MNNSSSNLADRIRDELADLQAVVQKCERAWQEAKRQPEQQDIFLDSVALNIHSIYAGIESLFELVARHIDGSIPTHERWHHELIVQMTQEIPEIRPAVISPESQALLDEFRRFRHLVRNVYTINLDPERLEALIRKIPQLWRTIELELNAFADFLDDLSQTEQKND